jgi:hypothetical protein
MSCSAGWTDSGRYAEDFTTKDTKITKTPAHRRGNAKLRALLPPTLEFACREAAFVFFMVNKPAVTVR